MTKNQVHASLLPLRLLLAFAVVFSALASAPVQASAPGRGLTAPFKVSYLEFIIDHHFAALRMTELAAGTQPTRTAGSSPDDGTSPTPGFAATPAKATLNDLKSLARRNNRGQREEIMTAQTFLKNWYGISYQPKISTENQQRIQILEQAAPGDDFNVKFMEVFSRHHYSATTRSVECLVSSELTHIDLDRYCHNIVNSQLSDIDQMRRLLCDDYNICDYQPLGGLAGRHS